MLIGIDASRANLEKKTGVEFYSYFLIQELKKIIPSEHQVLLYSPDPLRGDLAELPENWKWKKVRSPINLPIGKFIGNRKLHTKRPFLWTQLGLSLEMLWRPPDVLFVPSHALPFICPKNSFVTIHDIGFDRFPESYHWLARLYHRFVTRFAVWRARKIITISEFSKKELIDVYRAKSEKIVAIPNGYDSSRFHEHLNEKKKQQALEKYLPRSEKSELHPNDPNLPSYIFYVGRLEKKKNIVTLIKAFEIVCQMSNVKCQMLLAGSPAHGFDEIQTAIERSPVRDRIKILNYVPEEYLPYLISGASVFVFPSLYEGFGIPVLEAMAVGTPVVASDIPALREVANSMDDIIAIPHMHLGEWQSPRDSSGNLHAKHDTVLFANPNNPQDFAEKIKHVLANENIRQELITRGAEQVRKYSWVETARLTLKTLTD